MLADTNDSPGLQGQDTFDSAEIRSMLVSPDDVVTTPTAIIMFATGRQSLTSRPLEYPLWQLGEMTLQRPMIVTLEDDHGDVLVSNEELRIWGVGRDKFEALSDFAATFASVMRNYETTADEELSADALRYRARLRSYTTR